MDVANAIGDWINLIWNKMIRDSCDFKYNWAINDQLKQKGSNGFY